MNDRFVESREAVLYAREALKNGAMKEAREWAERAAQLAPQNEDPWLILATIAGPRESMEYIRKALEVNPNSRRAKQGLQWAMQRLDKDSPDATNRPTNQKQVHGPTPSVSRVRPRRRSYLFPVFLVVIGCAVFLFAAWSAVTSPALASILNVSSLPVAQPTQLQSFAQVNIAKPAYYPQSGEQESVAQADISAPPPALALPTSFVQPTEELSDVSGPQADTPIFELPTGTPYISPTAPLPEVSETPGFASVQIVPDTPTSEYVAPTVAPYTSPQVASYDGEHWIDVDLSQQRVYAYAGNSVVNSFVVSTGTWQTPTVTGKYKVWIKLRFSDMSGPGYYLPDVPSVMYFYKGYGLHGTYWHNNFGTPMSHGCVNLSIPDAEWLYNFSAVGTVVNVHY